MIYIVDRVQVLPKDAQRYLRLFQRKELQAAVNRGMKLVACWHTSERLGENVTIVTIWSAEDWSEWNDMRKAMVLDTKFHHWLDEAKSMWQSGMRRFYNPADFSPL